MSSALFPSPSPHQKGREEMREGDRASRSVPDPPRASRASSQQRRTGRAAMALPPKQDPRPTPRIHHGLLAAPSDDGGEPLPDAPPAPPLVLVFTGASFITTNKDGRSLLSGVRQGWGSRSSSADGASCTCPDYDHCCPKAGGGIEQKFQLTYNRSSVKAQPPYAWDALSACGSVTGWRERQKIDAGDSGPAGTREGRF